MDLIKTKTLYVGLTMIIAGIGIIITEKDYLKGGQMIMEGLGAITVRDAIISHSSK